MIEKGKVVPGIMVVTYPHDHDKDFKPKGLTTFPSDLPLRAGIEFCGPCEWLMSDGYCELDRRRNSHQQGRSILFGRCIIARVAGESGVMTKDGFQSLNPKKEEVI